MSAIQHILAGVDASNEGMAAGAAAWSLSRRAGATCDLVHATADTSATAWIPAGINVEDYLDRLTAGARSYLLNKMEGNMPPEAIERVEVTVGTTGVVLDQAAKACEADLVVLGGRRRSAASRWLEGSTVKHMVRRGAAPVLVAVPPHLTYKRILVAADMSSMMEPTVRWALEFARLFDAELQVLYAVEPLPFDYGAAIQQPADYLHEAKSEFDDRIRELVDDTVDYEVLYGPASRMISRQARRWNAGLIVVGSHGKGLVDRMLLGSTTSRLINELPASLLIIPPDQRTAVGNTESARSKEVAA